MADATGEPRAEPVRVSGWLSPEAQRLMSGSNDPLEGALQAQGMPRGRRVSWDEDPEAYEAQATRRTQRWPPSSRRAWDTVNSMSRSATR